MPPEGGAIGEDGCKDQGHPPATGERGREREDASPSSQPFPSPETSSEVKDEQQKEEEHPIASLPEDSLIEILSRVPYKSLCRFKCVSKPWLALCSATDIRKRSPQTLSGFFHFDSDGLRFRNLSGRGSPVVDPSLPFLRERYKSVSVEQCCSSLLLCQCYKSHSEGQQFDYVVCNPATEWMSVVPPIALPEAHLLILDLTYNIFLGFDPATPSRFVVFAPLSGYCDKVAEVAIYSSETGRWTFAQSQWGDKTILSGNPDYVFLNGIMHWTTIFGSSLVTVDADAKIWRKIKLPVSNDTIAYIGQSQGRLYAWQIDGCLLYIWVLEDYDSGNWTLKHTLNVLELFRRNCRKGPEPYKMFAIHPECNLIFITNQEMSVSYDLDNHKVHVISTSEEFLEGLPYTPCFAE